MSILKRHMSVLVLLASLLLGGCLQPASPPAAEAPIPPLVGQVQPGFLRRIQATIGTDIAPAASVSFIEPGATASTVVTTVTDSSGRFKLSLGSSFRPTVGAVYYLEAFKGLSNNLAGYSAARVRTLIQWQSGGWVCLTSSTPGGTLNLTSSTTAVSAAAQINTAQGSTVDLAGLMGKLELGTPDTFTPVTNLTVADYQGAYGVVSSALGGNLDPLASIGKANGAFYLKNVGGGMGLSPGLGADIGDTVTLSGLTFDATPANNQVAFNGAPATVTSVSPDRLSLQVTVPDGATRGPVSVIVGSTRSGVVDYPIFGTVRVSLAGIPGGSATASVTLTPGTGPAILRTVSNPGATASVEFKGLTPDMGWTVNAEAVNAANSAWATSTRIDGATDSVTLTPLPISGPYEVRSGLNLWGIGLRLAPLTAGATASY